MRVQTLILLVGILCFLGVSNAYRVSHVEVLDMEAEPNTKKGGPASGAPVAAPPAAQPAPPAAQDKKGPVPPQGAAGNASKPQPPAKDSKPQPPANGTKPQSPANGTKPQPPANGTKPQPPANATKPKPPANATAPGKKGLFNRTRAFKSRFGNGTKAVNGTKAANATKALNATKSLKKQLKDIASRGISIKTIKAGNISAILAANNKTRGPTAECPTCQHTRGRPKVDYAKLPNGLSFVAGPVETRAEVDEAFFRQVISTDIGDKRGRYTLGLSKIFVTNTTELVNGEVEASKRFKTVDFKAKGRDAPYKWDVSDPTNKFDATTNMYKYKAVATPKNKAPGALRPTIILEEALITNENVTSTKFDFKVNNFLPEYWNVPVPVTNNGTTTTVQAPTTHLAVVYTVQEITRAGEAKNPKPETIVDAKTHVNVTVPLVPVAGRDYTGEEVLDLAGVSVGGLDISGPDYAVTGAGNKKDVVMKVGKDADGQTAIYFFYQRFNNSMIHDPYVIPNSNSLDNSAGVATSVVALLATVAALCALF